MQRSIARNASSGVSSERWLAGPVAADKVKAQYRDGILTVTLPKTEESKPKHIDVNVN